MTSRTSSLTQLIERTQGRQAVIPLHPALVHLLGERDAALFLSQCYYLSETAADEDGWFEHPHQAWQTDLGLSADQIRRCVRQCGDLIEVKKMGLPARNFYRVVPEVLAARLDHQASDKPVTLEQAAPRPTTAQRPVPITSHPNNQSPVVGKTPPPVARQTPPHSSIRDLKDISLSEREPEKVEVLTTEAETSLLQAWNNHRGALPPATTLSARRRQALVDLLTDCQGNLTEAVALLTDATKEVASDEFWLSKRFGLDTLLAGKVLGRAEAWRSRTQTATGKAPTVKTTPEMVASFGVGQLVTYRRERYAIEAITDSYIDLYDEENGSARIRFTSDDIRAIRPVAVSA